MARNVGPEDRVVRIVVAVALAILIYAVEMGDTARIIVGVLAAYLLLTGLMRSCLVYRLIGVDTGVQEQSYSTTDDRAF